MLPLVDQLQPFCCGPEATDGGAAAAAMLAHVRRLWPEIPEVEIARDPEDRRGAEEIALGVMADVGRVAGILALASDQEKELAWARANPIVDMERYTIVVGNRH